MFSSQSSLRDVIETFRIDPMMRYSQFVPRLYNLCLSEGFEAGNIMPSRAFCSDENQGFPIILIAKHFGTFPFNHGQVGGIVATGRHGPHAMHGHDMVIIHASHVGYDADSGRFGHYRRLQTRAQAQSSSCGKIDQVISQYEDEYRFAQRSIFLGRKGEDCTVTIDNQLTRPDRANGLFLNLERLVCGTNDAPHYLHSRSTARAYRASPELLESLPADVWNGEPGTPIGAYLGANMFHYRRDAGDPQRQLSQLEQNLLVPMPWIVTAEEPLLAAAKANTQAEFDRAYRSIVRSADYRDKNLLFISCLNIDISPRAGQVFPLTKCVPWAAYLQQANGDSQIIEQAELAERLADQSSENPHQIDLEQAIRQMVETEEIHIEA